MKTKLIVSACLTSALFLTACSASDEESAEAEPQDLGIKGNIVIDASGEYGLVEILEGEYVNSLCYQYGGTDEQRDMVSLEKPRTELKVRLLDQNDEIIETTLATPLAETSTLIKPGLEEGSLIAALTEMFESCRFEVQFAPVDSPQGFYTFQAAIDEGTFSDGANVAGVTITAEELEAKGNTVDLRITEGAS